jgi:glycine/D-amino acid oxidase-like deaminating enzyme
MRPYLTLTATCSNFSEDGKTHARRRREFGREVSHRTLSSEQQADDCVVMGYTADFMPHVGQIPNKPGQFIIAGFNGHGMPQILLSSKALAAMVQNDATFEQTELPRLFKTSRERIERQDNPMEEGLKSMWDAKAKL